MTTDANLPAASPDHPPAAASAAPTDDGRAVARPDRPVRVALLPVAIATFVIIAFVMATWTFVATAF